MTQVQERLSLATSTVDRTTPIKRRWLWPDWIAAVVYLTAAGAVLSGQWRDLTNGYLAKSGQDQTMWEWFFAVAAHSVAHLENPLGTTLQNFPLGVNMMANTAMFGVSIPLAPITLAFGPTVTFALVLTLGLFSTALAWYWLFSRHLVSRGAAFLGGALCGFCPAMVSHANAHPNFVVLPLLPIIASLLLRIVNGDARPRRSGLALGLLIAAQIALGEEPLLIFAVAFAIFAATYYLSAARGERRAGIRAARQRLARPLAIAAAVALALTCVPLWWQFFGAQSYRSIDHGMMGNDLKSLVQFPSESLGGMFSPGQNVAINPTEENAYFGWPLLLLVTITAIWLWRNRIARAATVTLLVTAVLSLGSELQIGKRSTGIPLPWRWVGNLPLLESVLETRFAMAAVPAIAIVLMLATDRVFRRGDRSLPLLWSAGLALSLVPLVPTVLPVIERSPTPDFFTSGDWRPYLHGGSMVIVPLPRPEHADALRWQRESDFGFPIAAGYFVGPVGAEKKGKYGPEDRPTALLLRKVQRTGAVPDIDAATRAQAAKDLSFWRADVVVLPPGENNPALRDTVQRLLGRPGRQVDDVWVWDVR
ncbi:glycosyl transferase [Skermania sp. ID1734]|uniref:DUF6541 family protein n=1 Tax=Skermania sp. ID1734 TaxID=2597516 RepID=UPI00118073FB|nr:DUF6541 family protein [Skermania sp. ID1734]TSE00737.1 glycosyl transferase [Skermania sp. ID1734]